MIPTALIRSARRAVWAFLVLALGAGLMSCSQDKNDPAGETTSSEGIYLSFSFDTPTTKTATSDNLEQEAGTEQENIIKEVFLLLCDQQNNLIQTFDVKQENLIRSAKGVYIISVRTKLLNDWKGKTIRVFAYCNTPEALSSYLLGIKAKQKIDTERILTLKDINDASIWTSGSFLMTSADDDYERDIPNDLDLYMSPTTPYDMGCIRVERSAARFDYKTVREGNIYPIVGKGGKSVANIKLTHMALANMSRSFYLLRRVSKDGLNDKATLLGHETVTNFVVDTDAKYKKDYTSTAWSAKKDAFFYNVEDGEASLSFTSLSSFPKDEFKTWRYATENTIPSAQDQRKGISTAVVFKGEITPGADCPTALKNVLSAGTDPIYVFNNVLYGNHDMLYQATRVAGTDETDLSTAVGRAYEVIRKGGDPDQVGFTIFTPQNGKYITYFHFWNRHNDNGDDHKMGVMEFAVVRNNIYKISILDINRYGTPKVDPDDPDEGDEISMTVSVQAVPWVIRVNDIIF